MLQTEASDPEVLAGRLLPPTDALERNSFAAATKHALRKMRKTAHSGDAQTMVDLLTQAQSTAKKTDVRLPDTRDLQKRVYAEATARAALRTTRPPAEDWLIILDGTGKMDLNKTTQTADEFWSATDGGRFSNELGRRRWLRSAKTTGMAQTEASDPEVENELKDR